MSSTAAALPNQSLASPLRDDGTGAIRVGASNVLLEFVIQTFQDGATPEAIVRRFPTLTLADTYAVAAMYLKDPTPFEAYLAEREEKAKEVRERIERTQPDLSQIRARLQAAKR